MSIEEQTIKEYSVSYLLTAAECGPEQYMTPPLMVNRLIEVATLHANYLGIGYARLQAHGLAWVLSRVSLEMNRWPSVGEEYALRTWVEGCNRLFSQRNMEITSVRSGEVLGYARTIWMAIDIKRRVAGEIPSLDTLAQVVVEDRPCPIAPTPRLREPKGDDMHDTAYTFRYTDLDFNRHVNTVRYLELLIDQWPLPWHDAHSLVRLDMAFLHEAVYPQSVTVTTAADPDNPMRFTQQITGPDGPCMRAAFTWRRDEYHPVCG